MSLNSHSQASAESAGQETGYSDQRIVTVIAASLAVLIVAAIAVLMGMA